MLIGVIAEELLLSDAARSTALFIDVDLFLPAFLAVPGFLLLEGQFDSDDAISSPFITINARGIFPLLLNDNDVIYAFTRNLTGLALSPALAQADDAFYRPTILTNVLGPVLVDDSDVFRGVQQVQQGPANVSQFVPVSGVVDSDVFYSPIIERVGITLITQQAVLTTEDESIYLNETTTSTSVLSGSFVNETAIFTPPPLGFLAPNLFNPVDIVLTSAAFSGLLPNVIIEIDVIYPAFQGNYLASSAVLDIDSFLIPSIIRQWQLRPSAVGDVDVFIGPTISTPGRLGLVTDSDLILAPAVIGVPALAPTDAIVDFADTFLVPSVVLTTKQLTPHFWPDIDTVLAIPSVAIGQGAQPGIVIDTDTVLTPSLTASASLLLSVVTDTDALYVPTITQAGFDGTLALDGPIMPSIPPLTVILVEG